MTRIYSQVFVFLCLILSSGCSKEALRARDFLSHPASAHSLSRKHYFLVAGGSDSANFGQEIIEQKKYLLSQGVDPSDIACFYSIPSDEDFAKDQEQYLKLAADLNECLPASPKVLWQELRGSGPLEDFVYLYISSHGGRPFSLRAADNAISSDDRAYYSDLVNEVPESDQYSIVMDSLADGQPYDGFRKKIRNGERLEDLMLTPKHLKDVLAEVTSPTAKKYVVLQACYSGGFAYSDLPNFAAQTLSTLEEITILTAARYDRTSFGCDAGSERTYFGGAFTDSFRSLKKHPTEIEWRSLFLEVKKKVTDLENDYYNSLSPIARSRFLPSLPVFFSKSKQSWVL